MNEIVLEDPIAVDFIRAVEKHNCGNFLEANLDSVERFKRRAHERQLSPADVVVVLLAVDDPNGSALADILMPGCDWQTIRDRGEVPVARGLAGREGIQRALEIIDPDAAQKLREWVCDQIAVVVVDRGVAEVF